MTTKKPQAEAPNQNSFAIATSQAGQPADFFVRQECGSNTNLVEIAKLKDAKTWGTRKEAQKALDAINERLKWLPVLSDYAKAVREDYRVVDLSNAIEMSALEGRPEPEPPEKNLDAQLNAGFDEFIKEMEHWEWHFRRLSSAGSETAQAYATALRECINTTKANQN